MRNLRQRMRAALEARQTQAAIYTRRIRAYKIAKYGGGGAIIIGMTVGGAALGTLAGPGGLVGGGTLGSALGTAAARRLAQTCDARIAEYQALLEAAEADARRGINDDYDGDGDSDDDNDDYDNDYGNDNDNDNDDGIRNQSDDQSAQQITIAQWANADNSARATASIRAMSTIAARRTTRMSEGARTDTSQEIREQTSDIATQEQGQAMRTEAESSMTYGNG